MAVAVHTFDMHLQIYLEQDSAIRQTHWRKWFGSGEGGRGGATAAAAQAVDPAVAALAVIAFVWLLVTPAWGIKQQRSAVVSREDHEDDDGVGAEAVMRRRSTAAPAVPAVCTLDELNASLSAQMGEIRRLVRESKEEGGVVEFSPPAGKQLTAE